MAKETFQPKSTFLESANWDSVSEIMTLTFKKGSQYNYTGVSKNTWLSFKQSPNPSVFYTKAVKGNLFSTPINPKRVGIKRSYPLETLKLKKVDKSYGNSLFNRGLKQTVKRAGLSGSGTVPDSLYSQ